MPARIASPLHQVLAAARRRLVSAGIPEPEAAVDVDLIARSVLGWDEAQLIVARTSPAPDALEPRFSALIERRETREPMAYILGSREFWGLDLHITPAVLIPRPETEFVVEESLSALARDGSRSPAEARIADIGTGSGCIAVALAHELPDARIVATDVSTSALSVAQENARRLGSADRIVFVATAYLDAVAGDFDLIAANPPYVRDGDKPALAADVRYEPDVALFGGARGLRNIEGVLRTAARRLRPGGHLVMEFGFGQEDEVRTLAASIPPLRVERVREDLQGIPRTAIISAVRNR